MSQDRQNYLSASPRNGVFNYRRGIPAKYRAYFRKPDGSLRGKEWKQSLKTHLKSRALVLAARINENFDHTLMLAKGAHSSQADLKKRQEHRGFIETISQMGLHPEQAPSIQAPEKVQLEWKAKQHKLLGELHEAQWNFLEGGGDAAYPTYRSTETYDFLQDQIEFLEGKGDAKIKSRLRPTLGSATEGYIDDKVTRDPNSADPEVKAKLNRVLRVTESFAVFIDGRSIEGGMDTYLDHIKKSDARRWMYYQLENEGKKGSSVGRDMTVLTAIFNWAVSEHGRDIPELRKDYNPFSGLRSTAEEHHTDAIRTGAVESLASRPWTPHEVNAFSARLDKMNPELKLIAMLSMHTGARLKDSCGLRIEELHLGTDEDSFLQYRHNRNRKISKESIERRVPLFGNVLSELKSYLASAVGDEGNLFPRYCGKRQTNNVSAVLNNKHLDVIDKDPRLKMHGLRDTLSAKFMATSVTNDLSGYLIGWRNSTTVGMQKEYQKGGYPHEQMLTALRSAHSVTVWGTEAL